MLLIVENNSSRTNILFFFFLTILGRIPARELFNVKNFVIDRANTAARRLRNGGKAPDPATSN